MPPPPPQCRQRRRRRRPPPPLCSPSLGAVAASLLLLLAAASAENAEDTNGAFARGATEPLPVQLLLAAAVEATGAPPRCLTEPTPLALAAAAQAEASRDERLARLRASLSAAASASASSSDADMAAAAAADMAAAAAVSPSNPATVDLWFHVVAPVAERDLPLHFPDSGRYYGGDYYLGRQVDVMNRAYAPSGFSFRLAGVTRTYNNSRWANAAAGSPASVEMISALRRGDYATLNAYVVQPGGGLLGYATFPLPKGPAHNASRKKDGVVLAWHSLPAPLTPDPPAPPRPPPPPSPSPTPPPSPRPSTSPRPRRRRRRPPSRLQGPPPPPPRPSASRSSGAPVVLSVMPDPAPAPAPAAADNAVVFAGRRRRRRALLQQEQEEDNPQPQQQKVATVSPLYNQGKTLVHEAGHWLQVWHVFQGGCAVSETGGGDMCTDTPAARGPTFNCPPPGSVDTCPSLAGLDPLSNYMAYTSDACMDTFTPQQHARMSLAWQELRVGVAV